MDVGFIEEAPIPTYVVRRVADDFVIESVNAVVRQRNPAILGLLGTPMTRIYSDHPEAIEAARRCIAEQVVIERDLPVRRYDQTGATNFVRLRFVPAPPDHLLLFVQELAAPDISRTALEETEARYQGLLASLPNAVVLRATDGRILFANQLAVELFGYTNQAEMLGQVNLMPRDIVVVTETGQLIASTDSPSRRVLSTGKPERGVVWALRGKAGTRWVSIAAQPIVTPNGATIGSVTIYTDVTDRMETQAALRDSAARLDLALAAARMGVWEYDPCTDEGWCSANLFMTIGISQPITALAPFLEYVHPDDRERIRASSAATALRGGDGHTFEDEFRIVGDDEVTRWVRVQGRMTASGERRHLGGTLMDVTAQRLLEEQLHRASRLESIGRLAGGVAHDFNNLLAAMLGSLELMEGEVSANVRDDLATIRHSAMRARDLTRQLLAFARKQPVVWKTVDLSLLVRDIELLLRRLVGPTILIDIKTGGSALVSADAGLLEQVLVNLIVNARDAMPQGGRLQIAVETRTPNPNEPERCTATLSVTDSGVGMDEDTRRRIFEPFFTTKASGTGLGLASSYGIIQQHHGDISVVSEPGRGTRFVVSLPCLGPEARARPASITPPVARTAKGTVLVVDDEDAVRKTTARLVTSLGYQVFDAANFAEALARTTNHDGPIDMLLCDIAMPGEDGRDVAARLVELRPELKVLFMSGYSSDMQEMRLEGALFVQKPFSRDELAHKLAELTA
jgi:PAS domain S-box-containing protein